MDWLVGASLLVGSYVLGSVPFGFLLGLSRGIDIRRVGSGNIGATNLGRALGRRWAVAAFLLDYSKGVVPVVVAGLALRDWDPATRNHKARASGAAAVTGHIFPVFLRFRGGKGVATAFGAMSSLAWIAALAAGAAWGAVYWLTRTVSVASLVAVVCFPLAVWLTHVGSPLGEYLALLVFSGVLALAIIIRHRTNVVRLLRGEELSFKKRSDGRPKAETAESRAPEGAEDGTRAEAGRETTR